MANRTEKEKWKIWEKGEIVPGYDKNAWRRKWIIDKDKFQIC